MTQSFSLSKSSLHYRTISSLTCCLLSLDVSSQFMRNFLNVGKKPFFSQKSQNCLQHSSSAKQFAGDFYYSVIPLLLPLLWRVKVILCFASWLSCWVLKASIALFRFYSFFLHSHSFLFGNPSISSVLLIRFFVIVASFV